MISSMLVIHPAPYEHESLFGYVLRLSESNGYKSPWDLFRLAGITPSERKRLGLQLDKIAMVANCGTSSYDRLVSKSDKAELQLRQGRPILDKVLLLRDARPQEVHFCPACVKELGYIEASWGVPQMIGCPVHRRLAITTCPSCKQAITWFRRGLLTCKCGAVLDTQEMCHLTSAELSLVGLIRRKVLSLCEVDPNPAGLPLDNLGALDLEFLLRVIYVLAKHRAALDGSGDLDPLKQITLAAAVLADWPEKFVQLLKEHESDIRHFPPDRRRAEFRSVYRSLLRPLDRPMTREIDFILAVVVEYAAREWDYADPFHLRRYQNSLPLGLMSAKERRRGVLDENVNAVPRKDRPSYHAVTSPATRRMVRRRVHLDIERVLGCTATAEHLGIDHTLIRPMVRMGLLVADSRLKFEAVYRSAIDKLEKRFWEVTSPTGFVKTEWNDCIALDDVLRWPGDTPDSKVRVLQAVLDRQIDVVGMAGQGIPGLLIKRSQYHELIRTLRLSVGNDAASTREAARLVGCNGALIPSLIQSAVLQGYLAPSGLRIVRSSIETFTMRYVFLAQVAKEFQTSVECLLKRCVKLAIQVNWLRSGGTNLQPYIAVNSLKALRLSPLIAKNRRPVHL